ncbi:MAG: twin-arginine translocase TatA/TatE family subunit [Candidatus Binatia bacterium]
MFGLGFGELLIILAVAVLFFNRRLPDIGESFGAAIRKFKKAMNEPDEIDVTPSDQTKKRPDEKPFANEKHDGR